MKTELILVRHGQTAKNTGGKMHSAGDPELLNESGRKQIKLTAKKLKTYKPSAIYSSKEARANESAEIIAKVCKISMYPTENLQERNWGIFTGKTWPEIKPILEGKTIEERFHWIPDGGESWKDKETL